jgi:hypothetical protein
MSLPNNFFSIDFVPLIKHARAGANIPGKGKISGQGSDISIILLVDKYNRAFKTTDDSLQYNLSENDQFDLSEKTQFLFTFTNYQKLIPLLKKKDTTPQHLANISDLHSWISLRTLILLYKLEYLTKRKASNASAKSKNTVQEQAKEIWKKHNLGREEIDAIELKRLYEKEVGKPLNKKIGTITETWLPVWNKYSN